MNNLIPEDCPSCDSDLIMSGVHIRCRNKDCDEQIIQQMIFYCKKSEMDGISEATIRLFYENDILCGIKDLYNLNEDDYQRILPLEGMGEKKIKNLQEQIEKSKDCFFSEFMVRLGIESVGGRSIKKLGIENVQDFIHFSDETYSIGREVIAWKNNGDNRKLFDELIKKMNFKKEKENNMTESKVHVAMTGKGHEDRKKLIKDIETMGYIFDKSVTKTTQILICEDVNGNSNKLKKAIKSGIQLMAYGEFF